MRIQYVHVYTCALQYIYIYIYIMYDYVWVCNFVYYIIFVYVYETLPLWILWGPFFHPASDRIISGDPSGRCGRVKQQAVADGTTGIVPSSKHTENYG